MWIGVDQKSRLSWDYQGFTTLQCQDGQKVNSVGHRNPKRVSQYMLGTGELKSVVVLSNAQLFTRGLPIYNWVHEVPFTIPQGYVKGCSIYRWYVEEPRNYWVVVQPNNDISYILRCLNTSLTYHSNFYTVLDLKLPVILSKWLGECLWNVISNDAC